MPAWRREKLRPSEMRPPARVRGTGPALDCGSAVGRQVDPGWGEKRPPH